MKIEEIAPPPTENLVVLTLTVEEAALIREFARHYAASWTPHALAVAAPGAAAAARCRDLLEPYNSKYKYPYDKAFK